MSYLHDMHIAHCGLKPTNTLVIIVNSKIINKIIQYTIVKMIEFGMFKIEVGSNPETT